MEIPSNQELIKCLLRIVSGDCKEFVNGKGVVFDLRPSKLFLIDVILVKGDNVCDTIGHILRM